MTATEAVGRRWRAGTGAAAWGPPFTGTTAWTAGGPAKTRDTTVIGQLILCNKTSVSFYIYVIYLYLSVFLCIHLIYHLYLNLSVPHTPYLINSFINLFSSSISFFFLQSMELPQKKPIVIKE